MGRVLSAADCREVEGRLLCPFCDAWPWGGPCSVEEMFPTLIHLTDPDFPRLYRIAETAVTQDGDDMQQSNTEGGLP